MGIRDRRLFLVLKRVVLAAVAFLVVASVLYFYRRRIVPGAIKAGELWKGWAPQR